MSSSNTSVVVLYPRTSKSTFDLDYYISTHMPLAAKAWKKYGLETWRVAELDENAPYSIHLLMVWADREGFNNALQDPATQEIMADVKNFSNETPIFIPGNISITTISLLFDKNDPVLRFARQPRPDEVPMAFEQYVVLQGLPSPRVYHDLRKLANLTPPPAEAMEEIVPKSLQNSFACFVAYVKEDMVDEQTPGPGQDAIAMGRLLGDGALFLQLVDVAVHPHHQRNGLGKRIVELLVGFADEHAPHAYVSLVADLPGQQLYQKYGFEDVKPSICLFRCLRIQGNVEARRDREARQAVAAQHTGDLA
ncbi:acetyltransferase, GNAT family [Curvularia clavata]|uniref:Acetyltransferase, GNAT family n=1 Tax=Curvularia clavata TaxID=95742 RepID=A0A9Q9DN78_CURCL|nr:acetyltransferase, GNAT family [Curvularia clavata]